MKGYQYSYNDEINKAKKIFYEGNDTTKKTLINVILCLVGLHLLTIVFQFSLLILLVLSLWGTSDTWVCEIDSQSPKHDFICKELRKAVNCKTVSGPIKAEVLLNVNNEVKASALAVCPWEIAISELRVCFILLSVVCVFVGLFAIRQESKKTAELFYQGAIFGGLILLISSYFDYLSVQNSDVNNYNLCNLQNEFAVEEGIKGELMECSFTFYNITIIFELISSALLLLASKNVYKWKSSIIVNEL